MMYSHYNTSWYEKPVNTRVIVNKKQLEAKKKFLEAYMRKELPDLYESGAVKILTE